MTQTAIRVLIVDDQAIVRLESQYPHPDILAALKLAVDHGYFDPLAVEYLLRVVSLTSGAVPPTPTSVQIAVEERSLRSYDLFIGGGER